MSRGGSLQRQLSLRLAAGVLLVWLAAALGGGYIIRHELDEAFDSALQETAQRLLSLATSETLQGRRRIDPLESSAIDPKGEYLTYLVRDADGGLLLQSHALLPDSFPPQPVVGFRSSATHRLYGEVDPGSGIVIEVAEPLAHRREAAAEAALSLLLPFLLLVPLSLLGVWWLVRRSMQPVRRLRAGIEARGAADLSPVGASLHDLPEELEPIAESVDRLLERLRRAIEAERSFSENSAHELRTPIAAALAQTQRLIAEADEGPQRDRARRIEESLRRLTRMAEKLLQLTRAEGGALTAGAPRDLLPVLRLTLEELEREPQGRGRLRLRLPAAPALPGRMDPDAFAILLRNLIENALKHSPEDTPVEIRLAEDGALRIVNAGPAVPPEALRGLKRRFARGAATTALGAGLGLAIAEAIAQRGGASLELYSPASGRQDGFEATLRMIGD